MSQVLDVEVNPSDVAGVRIRYKLGTAEFNIALSALYQLLLLNPKRGCTILSGLREWERSRRLTDTWAANTRCWASMGELGWEGCADEEILLSSCGLNHPNPASPRSASPRSPPWPRNPNPLPCPPPKPTQPKKTPPPKRKPFKSGSSSTSDQTLPCPHEKVKGKQPQQQKRHQDPPSLEGVEAPDPLLGEQVYVPYTDGVYPGVVTSVLLKPQANTQTRGKTRTSPVAHLVSVPPPRGSHKSPVWAIEVANSVIGWDGWAAGNKQKCSTSTEAHCTHACTHTHHPTSKTKAQARLS